MANARKVQVIEATINPKTHLSTTHNLLLLGKNCNAHPTTTYTQLRQIRNTASAMSRIFSISYSNVLVRKPRSRTGRLKIRKTTKSVVSETVPVDRTLINAVIAPIRLPATDIAVQIMETR